VRGNKSDHNDAVAIAEASRRPNITDVPVKTVAQQEIQSLHRMRDLCVQRRTSIINQSRGLLSEYGLVSPKGHKAFTRLITEICAP
jgi:transposase